MFAMRANCDVAGSKISADERSPDALNPPVTSTRPSARSVATAPARGVFRFPVRTVCASRMKQTAFTSFSDAVTLPYRQRIEPYARGLLDRFRLRHAGRFRRPSGVANDRRAAP